MPHFILIRHGESQLNVINRQSRVFCGQVDTPLTERGREQARTAGKVLAAWADLRISAAISSALGRCRESLDLILQELPYPVQRLATWADRIEYWHVDDIDCATADEVPPVCDTNVEILVERLAGRGQGCGGRGDCHAEQARGLTSWTEITPA